MDKIQRRERIEYLDYAKALSIFMVLMCHRLLLIIPVLGFAMPAFFIISGYTSKNRTDLREYAIRLAKRLLVPYWTACAVYCVLDVVRAYAFGYSDWHIVIPGFVTLLYGSSYKIPVIGGIGEFIRQSALSEIVGTQCLMDIMTPLNCHLWFLPVMFSGAIIFSVIMRYRKANMLRDILLIVVLILVGAIELIPGMIQLPYGIGRAFPAAAYMLVGRIFKEKDIFDKGGIILRTCIAVITAAIGVFLGTKGYMNGGWNSSYYGAGGVLGLYLSFIAGMLLVYAGVILCKMIWRSPFKKLKYVLGVIGRNTMPVYLWHYILFMIADMIAVHIFNYQMTPDIYWGELFDGNYLLYRWIVLLITWAVLVGVGEYKNNRYIKTERKE